MSKTLQDIRKSYDALSTVNPLLQQAALDIFTLSFVRHNKGNHRTYCAYLGIPQDQQEIVWNFYLDNGLARGDVWNTTSPWSYSPSLVTLTFTQLAAEFFFPLLTSSSTARASDMAKSVLSRADRDFVRPDSGVLPAAQNIARAYEGRALVPEIRPIDDRTLAALTAWCIDWITKSCVSLLPAVRAMPRCVHKSLVDYAVRLLSADEFADDAPLKRIVEFLKKGTSLSERELDPLTAAFETAGTFLAQGHPESLMAGANPQKREILQAVAALNQNAPAVALTHIKKSLKLAGSGRFFPCAWENWIYGLTLYLNRAEENCAATIRSLASLNKLQSSAKFIPLEIFLRIAIGDDCEKTLDFMTRRAREDKAAAFFLKLTAYNFNLLAKPAVITDEAELELLNTHPFLAQQLYAALGTIPDRSAYYEAYTGMKPPMPRIRQRQPWESTVDRLIALSDKKNAEPVERLAFLLNPQSLNIRAVIQRSRDGVVWSSGRAVSDSMIAKGLEAMTQQDYLVFCEKPKRSYSWRDLKGPAAVHSLIGHPYVFDGAEKVQIFEEPLEVQAVRTNDGFTLTVNADPDDKIFAGRSAGGGNEIFFVRHHADNSLSVVTLNKRQQNLVRELMRISRIPPEGEDKLRKLLAALSADMRVTSELIENDNRGTCAADNRISLQIAPAGSRFELTAAVYPVQGNPVSCTPGKGAACVAVSGNAEHILCKRDLAGETRNFETLEKALAGIENARRGPYEWSADTEECLTALESLRNLEDKVIVGWPKGARLTVRAKPLDFSALNLTISGVGQWFTLDGDVTVDERTRIKIAELLNKIRSAKGRFVELADGDWAELTLALKKRLEAIERVSLTDRNGARFSRFQLSRIDELREEGADVSGAESIDAYKNKLAAAQEVSTGLPRGLKVKLRGYQKEGYAWLKRLAAWEAGALLADDMGLGKTVQAISLLASRAKDGPQLVVAPASVLMNWRDELMRFAPGLEVCLLNLAENRAETLKAMNPKTIVLATYAVMTAEIDLLRPCHWATVVFDEAHCLKNKETKGFKAASTLTAGFRLLLTGTPLQNRLSELWALFELALPGFFISFKRFEERFVRPIEAGDEQTRTLLKRIISPFILRRTKNDVLKELPEKTEVTVKVRLSAEEQALYEEIREKAAQRLAGGEMTPVQALSALMKLRLAACSPELVDPELKLPSSKTEEFLKLTEELTANNHRALVFSQFTAHLALIRKALEARGIGFCYLDGSMSPAERIREAEKFTAGNAPLFLISLKAGGTGLNLTAADYVIHLDPWWNPAVEDQASDRAYRIGQERPVTIYRLIAEGTVEEKILRLHGTKKSLADALLEGTDMSQRLGRKEILELLDLAQD